jgi:hypothetical protein
LLIALIIFSAGCANRPAALPVTELDAAVKALEPEAPAAPEEEPVRFEERDGGLWLSYENYRALERNVIALREYAARLSLIAEYYREER